jgi:hypothetical protein
MVLLWAVRCLLVEWSGVDFSLVRLDRWYLPRPHRDVLLLGGFDDVHYTLKEVVLTFAEGQ